MLIEKDIINLYIKTFDIVNKQKHIILDENKKSLEDLIPFYHEDKLYYDSIKELFEEWLLSGRVLISDESIEKILRVYEYLNDEDSSNTYKWYIQFRITLTLLRNLELTEKLYLYPLKNNKFNLAKLAAQNIKRHDNLFKIKDFYLDSELYLISESWICETYSLNNICEPLPDEIIIDAGAYKGETSLWFADKIGINGKVYAFEVIQSHVDTINKIIEINGLDKVIQCVNKGLWDKNTIIYAQESKDATKCSDKESRVSIKVVTLDSFIKENKIDRVDFIKMDIEGAEMSALKGSEKTIKAFKPKLAICLYHRYNDLTDIPNYIKSIVPEYKIFIAQKTPVSHSLVMYACV